MDPSWVFKPVKLCARPVDISADGSNSGGVAIVAEDADGIFQGIVAPSELAVLLEEFLPTSGPRFLEFWQTYEVDRGGDCFFWDLRRIADAIATSPDLPALRKLSGAKNAIDFMHSAYQAHVMAIAHRYHRGQVVHLRADKRGKSPDFEVTTDLGRIECEVKTIRRRNVIDLLDEGLQIGEVDRGVFLETIEHKIDEALAQTGPAGLVIIAVWCDSLGMVLGRMLTDWECAPDLIFAPGQVVLTCRDHGQDRWFAFPTNEKATRIAELRRRLEQVLPPPFSIPFAGSSVSVTNATAWISTGRMVAINNRHTPVEYTENQLAEYRASRPFRDVPLPRLRLWDIRWRLIEPQVQTFQSTVGALGGRQYRLEELLEQPAGLAVFHWLACLHAAVHQAFESSDAVPAPLRSGPMFDDYVFVSGLLGRIGAAFWLAPSVDFAASLILPLVQDRKAFAAVRRVTNGYGKLLGDELALRSSEGTENRWKQWLESTTCT